MLKGAALRIVERAIDLRVKDGEDVETVVRKLSEEQMNTLIKKYTTEEAEDLGVEKEK